MRFASALLMLGVATATAGAQGTRPSPATIAAAVDSFAQRVITEGVAPAFGVAVVMDGRTILARSHGWSDASHRIPADEQTLWYVASTSKSFTGFAVALLAAQGRLDLDAPIATLLPGVEWPSGADPHSLTLARFLSHTHHLNDNAVVMSAAFTGAIPESQWPSLIKYATVRRDTDLVYSNFGYNVAAMVIDALRPEGWKRYLDSAVFRPAGMTGTFSRTSGLERRIATAHTLDRTGAWVAVPFPKRDVTMNSAGGQVATLADLARWITVQMDSGMLDGRRVFPANAVALSHQLIARQTREQARHFGPFEREGWAAGWDVGSYEGEPMISRFGSYMSTRSHISFLPRRRIGVVAETNGPFASAATDVVAQLVYDLEAGRPDAREQATRRLMQIAASRAGYMAAKAESDSIRASRQKPLEKPLRAFVGSYAREEFGTVSFERRDTTLWYRWGVLSGPAEVYDAGRNVLRIEFPGGATPVAFSFPVSGDGPAEAIDIQGMEFKRVAP